ncbi:alpha-ketoglutarate-dependent dioxygenase AlkB family protein [Pontibacter harenae]|uniref:alpha-ketoglutarate-dependent dioxygenase AlkB family protein n=1 Tax=Pontibacter harenae TaxID=2894083 RepID=UPI001E2890E6|nr:alpha-ketoglutarate-dependent dioxygenase AlkB [Pontibacter harenae]
MLKNFERLPLPDAEVYYCPRFFSLEESNRYLQELLQTINWKQESIKLFGKEQPMPRLTAWYGEKGYTYSGLHNAPQPWLPVLQELKERVEEASGQTYNSVLLNLYRTGQDSMGWHSDDEVSLGQEPDIVSLSFGGERRFSFKHRTRKDLKPQSITLVHGSLLLMKGPTQHHWLHSLPKTSKPVAQRINLTFRTIKS